MYLRTFHGGRDELWNLDHFAKITSTGGDGQYALQVQILDATKITTRDLCIVQTKQEVLGLVNRIYDAIAQGHTALDLRPFSACSEEKSVHTARLPTERPL